MKKKVVAFTTVAILSSTIASHAFADTYKVQKGDTLSHIAKKYGISVSQLKTLNNLSSDLIYVDQTLKVTSSPTSTAVTGTQAKVPATANVQGKTAATPVTTSPAVSKTSSSSISPVYTVVKGDTLGKIANQHRIALSDLMKWNNLTSYLIYPGQVLKVSSNSTTGKTESVKEPSKEEGTSSVANTSEYTVVSGDTLGHISIKAGMSVEELKKLNNLSSDLIYVGQKLKLKAGSAPDEETTPEAAPENSKTDSLNPVNPESLIDEAIDLLGTPYAWAGSTPDGFDCSGFIHYVLNESGTSMTRQSTEGYYSRSYYIDEPQPGDFVFFENTYKAGISHMGIYLGNDEFIHASSSKGVMISNLNEPYYESRFDGFKRLY